VNEQQQLLTALHSVGGVKSCVVAAGTELLFDRT
jgi:hypothetical protein